MAEDRKIESDSPDLLVRYRTRVDAAMIGAVRDVVLAHKRTGLPVAVAHKGGVVLLRPEQIELPDETRKSDV